jgi:hypothetical protein
MQRDQNSLIYRFELKGYNFKKFKNYEDISYQEIEEIVIRFRNSYPVSFYYYYMIESLIENIGKHNRRSIIFSSSGFAKVT